MVGEEPAGRAVVSTSIGFNVGTFGSKRVYRSSGRDGRGIARIGDVEAGPAAY